MKSKSFQAKRWNPVQGEIIMDSPALNCVSIRRI